MNKEDLLQELKGLEFSDLVNLYLEARDGKPIKLSATYPVLAELVYELEEFINGYRMALKIFPVDPANEPTIYKS